MFRINADATIRSLNQAGIEFTSSTSQALGQAARQAAFVAKQTTTFKNRTGHLRASVVVNQRGPYSYFVKAGGRTAKYGLFVEVGTKAHAIVPKHASTLRFVVGGAVVFRRKVQHPGTKATHFMRDAAEYAEHHLVRFIESGVRRAFA